MAKKIEVGSAEWYKANPHVIKGSVREATAADKRHLGHVHKNVCFIKCTRCHDKRLVNTQDAFQAKFCPDCRKEVKAERRRARNKKRAA